jgi:hypothetical protein
VIQRGSGEITLDLNDEQYANPCLLRSGDLEALIYISLMSSTTG